MRRQLLAAVVTLVIGAGGRGRYLKAAVNPLLQYDLAARILLEAHRLEANGALRLSLPLIRLEGPFACF